MKINPVPKNVVVIGPVGLLTDAAIEMIYLLLPLFITTLGSGKHYFAIIYNTFGQTAAFGTGAVIAFMSITMLVFFVKGVRHE